ncbi:hypothetical protein UCD39_10210 [Nitrospirillum sp. BR 11752]|uniref:hypothetical protein n=1 Tax=Nitrospirillum sp. BR 11752 TaxID=3104293 RepID=UPI002EBF509C|nr:hypothetical protein [Nitrospirillum sp. BR 11752]
MHAGIILGIDMKGGCDAALDDGEATGRGLTLDIGNLPQGPGLGDSAMAAAATSSERARRFMDLTP